MAGKGSLILVLGFSIIMGYMLYNLIGLGRGATENVSWYNAATASKNLANIGAHVGLAMLREDPENDTTNWSVDYSITEGPYKGGEYTVSLEVNPSLPGRFTLQSVSSVPHGLFSTIKDTVTIDLRRENILSMYAWYYAGLSVLSDFPFNWNDIIWGPVHSDHFIPFNSIADPTEWPRFHGKVTVAQNVFPDPPDAHFMGGLSSGESKIGAPILESTMEWLSDPAQAGGLYYDDDEIDYFINLEGDNVEIYEDCAGPLPVNCGGVPNKTQDISAFNQAMYFRGDIYIRGTLAGQLSIGTEGAIKIVGNIKYATDPPYTTETIGYYDLNGELIPIEKHIGNGSDLLGLFTHKEILLRDMGPLRDLTVHGSLWGGIIWAENCEPVGSCPNPTRKFHLWGSASMKAPKLRGFQKRVRYDTRFEDSSFRPPHFPGFQMEFFEIAAWRESVQIPPF